MRRYVELQDTKIFADILSIFRIALFYTKEAIFAVASFRKQDIKWRLKIIYILVPTVLYNVFTRSSVHMWCTWTGYTIEFLINNIVILLACYIVKMYELPPLILKTHEMETLSEICLWP